MVSSFRNFMASRDNRAATYAPPAPRVHQPDPNYAPFQESDYYNQFKEEEREIRREGTTGWGGGRWGGPRRIDTTEKSVENLRKQKQTEYDDWVRQRKVLDETPAWKGMNGEEFDHNKESHREFIARDKAQFVTNHVDYMDDPEKHMRGSSRLEQAEELYYEQVLTVANNTRPGTLPLLMSSNERINIYDKFVTDLMTPIEIAGQKTQVTGLQERQLQKTSGPRRMRAYAGVVANPMNEEFVPVVTSQALFSMPGAATGNETLEKAGATAGEWIGFGFGIGRVGRSLRWMTEDISIPFKIIRGSYRAIHKKFGSQAIRKPAQLSYVIDNAGQAPPSVALDANERKLVANFTPEESLAYAARDAGGTAPPAGSKIWIRTESQIRVEGQTETIHSWKRPEVAPLTVVHEGPLTKTYQITDTDSYFRASGEILNLSPQQVEQASKISRPIIKALAESFGIDEATYIQGLVPAVRETAERVGQPYAARVIPTAGAGDDVQGLGDALMDSIFRRSASLVEFVKTSETITNDADSMITIQHELAHIVLKDIFRLVANGTGGQAGSIDKLSDSLKSQVLVRAEITGEALTSAQRQAINNLTTDDIAALLGDTDFWQPSSLRNVMGSSAEEWMALRNSPDHNKKLLARDLQRLLHEAGADLFAKYTFDAARGQRTKAAREAMGIYDDAVIWQATSIGLDESFKLLRAATPTPHGIATPQNYHQEKIVNSFSSVIEEIAAGKIYVDKKIAPQQLTYLAREFAKRTNAEALAIRAMADYFLGGKRTLLREHQDEIVGDLVDSDVPHFFDGTNARYLPLAREIFTHPSYEKLYMSVMEGTIPKDDYFKRVDELRHALTDVLRNPNTKVASIHDILPEVRGRLELVDETPELLRRVQEGAFKNEAGEPIVFYTGVAEDYGQDFQHLLSKHFQGLLGPGKYMDDWDVVGGSYAAQRFVGGAYDSTTTARVQAFYSLVPESKTMSLEGFVSSDPV